MSEMLTADTLWPRVREQSIQAADSGALVPLETSVHTLEDQGVPFIVRMAQNLDRKKAASPQSNEGPRKDPFLPPYEPDLYVGDICATHVGLLNKFCVLQHHLLMVTRDYAEQTELLDESDFHALLCGLAAVDGLAFYNGGTDAGASQPHKHLQLVPLPLAPGSNNLPLAPKLIPDNAAHENAAEGTVSSRSDLPFAHAITPMPRGCLEAPEQGARQLLGAYHALWSALGFKLEGRHQPIPYNLLATREWLWLVPRSRETWQGLGANGLAFAGALMVRDPSEYTRLESLGPMRLLTQVTTAWNQTIWWGRCRSGYARL